MAMKCLCRDIAKAMVTVLALVNAVVLFYQHTQIKKMFLQVYIKICFSISVALLVVKTRYICMCST